MQVSLDSSGATADSELGPLNDSESQALQVGIEYICACASIWIASAQMQRNGQRSARGAHVRLCLMQPCVKLLLDHHQQPVCHFDLPECCSR